MRSSLILLFVLLLGASLALAACGGSGETTAPAADEIDINALAPSIDVQTAYAARSNPTVFMLDVREPDEYDAGHIPGITLIPMGEIADRLSEIPTDQEVVVTCRTGNRSGQVQRYLQAQGFTQIYNIAEGMAGSAAGPGWLRRGLPLQ